MDIPMGTYLEPLRCVLEGHYRALDAAFVWDDTAKGHRYWQERHQGVTPLSDSDMVWLQELYDEVSK